MDNPGTTLLVAKDANDAELALAALGENRAIPRVLVAEDDEEVLNHPYYRGVYALRPAASPKVVLDLEPPKAGGLEVLALIKADPAIEAIPRVMPTAARQEGDSPKSYDLGTNVCVAKPIDYSESTETIRGLSLFRGVPDQPPNTMDQGR